MVVVPLTMPAVASPAELMVATPTSLDTHVTWFVKSNVLGVPLNVPIATNCDVSPGLVRTGTGDDGGMIAMETSPFVETVTVAVPLRTPVDPFMLAVMVVVPVATAVTTPILLTVATEGVMDVHWAPLVIFCVVSGWLP
jgi:hypothetical protein